MKTKKLKDCETNDARNEKKRKRLEAWDQSEIFRQPQNMKFFFVMLMGHQIIEFWMLCAVNLSISFKAHKNIRKLIFIFSSFCVDFELRCQFFTGSIALRVPLNPFEFGCRLQLFSQHGTTQTKYYWPVCVISWCAFWGSTQREVFIHDCVPKSFDRF